MVMLTLRNSWVRDGNYVVGSVWEGWPGEGPITQVYGQMSVTGHPHSGTDIAAPYRSDMIAPIDGYARHYSYGDFGNHVIIQPAVDDEYGQLYFIMAHMDSFENKTDRQITAGTLLGKVGFSGLVVPSNIDGTHIHFGVGIDPLISGDYKRCIDPYIFIQRAEQEDDMSNSRLGLQFISGGDFTKMHESYEVLRKNGILDQLFKEGLACAIETIDPADYLHILNASVMMRAHLNATAASDLSDQAYALVQ